MFGQSSASRYSNGTAASPVDFTSTTNLVYTVTMDPGDGFAVRVDFIGNDNSGYLASSRNIVRTFITIQQVGWS